MRKRTLPRSTWAASLGLSLILFAIVAALSLLPFMVEWQSRLNDTYLRLAPTARHSSPIVLVLVDDESLRQYGRWPWSRALVGKLVERVADSGASVIGIDILFTEPQTPLADSALRQAFERAPHVVLADKIGASPAGARWFEPTSALFAANVSVGHSLAPLDRDGVCRRFPPLELSPEGRRWAFAVELAKQFDPHRATAFLDSYGIPERSDSEAFSIVRPRLVPIAFRRGGFATSSAAALLEGTSTLALRGRPVLIGFGPADLGDRFNTPLSGELPSPGIEIHAQILDSILSARTIHESPPWLPFLLTACASPLLIFLFRTTHRWNALVVTMAIAAGAYAFGYAMFTAWSWLLPVGPLLEATVLAPLLTFSADFLLVERSMTAQLRELEHWLLRVSPTRSVPPTHHDLSWRLETLEHLQSELGARYELHRALLDATQDSIALFDDDGRLILSNPQYAALPALPHGPAVSFAETLACLLPALPADADLRIEKEILLEGRLYALRTAVLPPTSLSPRGGSILTLTSLEARQERDRARGEALGFLTHELRTPLASIQQFADLMMHYPHSPASAHAPETIFRESKRLLALISSYLDVLRLDAGARPLRRADVQLETLVADVFDILQPLTAAKGMALRLSTAGPTSAWGDAPLLTGAVLNLVSNAIKYGTPDTEIVVRCVSADGSATLSVTNVGTPGPGHDLSRLFDPFYRSPGADTETPGWGLGLAFVRRIVEKHGGLVHAIVRDGQTVLEIQLPAKLEATSGGTP